MNRRALLSLALALMFIAVALPSTASADPGWDHYRNITITNGSGSDLTSYPIRLHITDTTNMKDDGADLRFTNEENTVKYPYWAETGKWETDNAYVWVKVSLIPAAGCTIKMWYGNPSASSESDRAATTGIGIEAHVGIRTYSNWVGLGRQRSITRSSDGTLHCVYRASGIYSIYYSYSSDGGQTWSDGIDIDGVDYESYAPSIAVDSSDNLHVVWYGGGSPLVPGCVFNIQYRQKTASGWQNVEHVTDMSTCDYDQHSPAIAVDSNDNVHVVWYGDGWDDVLDPESFNIHYRQRSAAGEWGNVEHVTDTVPGEEYGDYYWEEHDRYPSLAIDSSNNVHVVWRSERYHTFGAGYMRISYRERGSSGWGSIVAVVDKNYNDSQWYPEVAVDSNNNVHVMWDGKGWGSNTSYLNIQYRERAAGGTWGSVEHVTDVTSSQTNPSVATDSHNNVHVVWEGSGIQYRQKTSEGWQAQSNPSSGQYPSLLWARHPTLNGVMTNVPHQGYIYVHYAPTTPYAVWYYGSPGTAVVFGSATTEPTYIIGGQSPSGAEDPVPELSTIVLLGTGLAVLSSYIWMRNRRRDRAVPA